MKRTIGLILSILSLIHESQLMAHPGVSDAVRHFSQQIEQSPDNQALYIQRGIVYSNDGQFDKAELDFATAAGLGDPVFVSCEFGLLRYREGKMVLAKSYFDAFLRQFPNHAQCLEYRARLLRDMGNYEQSLIDMRNVIRLQTHPNPGLYLSAARMLVLSRNRGVDDALELIDDANGTLGLVPQLQRYAIDLEIRRGNYANALSRLDTLERLESKSPRWNIDRGELLIKMDRDVDARHFFQVAIEQLETLRLTPARAKLFEQAESGLEIIENRNNRK